MPYNPSSAYPRHSTYTPPVEGRGFARGFNEFDWGQRFGHPNQMPGVDVNHAIAAGARRPDTSGVEGALTAQNRVGPLGAALQSLNAQGTGIRQRIVDRMIWNRAEYGDDPNEKESAGQGSAGEPSRPPAEIDTRTVEGRAAAAKLFPGSAGLVVPPPSLSGSGRERGSAFPAKDTGGRAHVAPVNDRLDDIEKRETRTSAMNDTASKVINGKAGGRMAVPFVFGPFRRK